MMNRLMILFAVTLSVAASRPVLAGAFANIVFDTVDSVALQQSSSCVSPGGCFIHNVVVVTGIRRGQSTPETHTSDFGNQADIAAHCQRLAMIAMAKPGKYRFGIGVDSQFNSLNQGNGACSLTLVSP